MEQTTQQQARPSHWQTLGWPWNPLAATTDTIHLPVRGDLHFWAGMHARMAETACPACRDAMREAMREAMRTFCRERRAEHLLQPLLQPHLQSEVTV